MENNNKELKETYNKIAKDWSKDHEVDTWWIEGADKFLSLLPKDATILDVGCGGGLKTKYINDKGYKNVEGVDFSEGMIEEAKRKSPELPFEVFDIYNIDKYPKTFDGLFVQAVLLHVPKKRITEVFKKLKSKLNNGGLLYVAVKEIKDNTIEEETKTENDYGYKYERFFSYFTLDELKNDFKNIGLEIVAESIVNSGRSNWINIIGKNNLYDY